MPAIPATQEAEARESLELRRQRLQGAEIAPLHSSLGNMSETPTQKKSQSKKAINYIHPLYNTIFWKGKTIETVKRSVVARRRREGRGKKIVMVF